MVWITANARGDFMVELLFKDEVYAIIGAAMEVYNHLGPGFGEAIYQEAMEIESDARGMPNTPQQEIYIAYKGTKLKQFFKPDFIYYEKIVVEIKAMDKLTSREEAQLLNYLKATELPVGVLINFGRENDLEWKRMAFTGQKSIRTPRVIIPPSTSRINDPKHVEDD
jgi:GxxExxY protein